MPYPFAHPAAILPLMRPLGRFAAPSALAIGSMVPDAWYLVPGLWRDDSHGLAGLFLFCLPAGLFAYCLFQFLLKEPLLALAPAPLAARLARAATPRPPWAAVSASLLAGATTHLLWDAATHERYVVNGLHLLQHASTLAGTLIVLAWLARWYRRTPPAVYECTLRPPARWSALALFVTVTAGFAGAGVAALPSNVEELRFALRTAGMAGVQALLLSLIGYALLWKVLRRREMILSKKLQHD